MRSPQPEKQRDAVTDGRHLMDRPPMFYRRGLYFDPRGLVFSDILSPREHVALWRKVLADWEVEKAKMEPRTGEATG